MIRENCSLAGEFRDLNFGDVRRGRRFRSMLSCLAARPAGRVSDVYRSAGQRQGAYDLLEHDGVGAKAVQLAGSRAVAKRCAGFEGIYVALDGSSLTLTDRDATKGFGSIGARVMHARGLKVLNALAIGPDGQTVGVIAQRFWARRKSVFKGYRLLRRRESHHWHVALDSARDALGRNAPETRMHVLADREGDASLLMQRIVATGCDFTIRANGTRKVLVEGQRINVRDFLKTKEPLVNHSVAVPARHGQPARIASLEVRTARVCLVLRDHHRQLRRPLPLTVVWARESVAPRNAKRLDWMLYTTTDAETGKEALEAITRYSYRWRIEDFHRILKKGGGCVEDSQLRSPAAVIKWATLHSIVAGRAQRLRDAARTTPELPVSAELSEAEIEALLVLKTQEKRRTETISRTGLTLKLAVRWIADLGGFTATGKSQVPPGATVIGRGLERISDAVKLLDGLRALGKLR